MAQAINQIPSEKHTRENVKVTWKLNPFNRRQKKKKNDKSNQSGQYNKIEITTLMFLPKTWVQSKLRNTKLSIF